MYNKKRVGLLLVLSLFILLLVQSAFALFAEYLYFGGFDLFDPITSYYGSPGFRNVFHFLLFFFLISGIAKAFVGIHWGEDKVQKLSFLYIALGVLGGFSLSLLFFQYNWSIAGFGWLFFLLIIFLILITGYRLLVHGKEEGKKGMSIWMIIGMLVLAFFLIEFLFPQVSGYFQTNELWNQAKSLILVALLILAIAGFLKSVFEGSFGGGHGGGGAPRAGGAQSVPSSIGKRVRRWFAPEPYEHYVARRGREIEEGERKGREEAVRTAEARREALRREKIRVVVVAQPERRFYTPRDTVRLYATVVDRRGRERHGRYRYRWIAGRNPIGEGRTLNLQIGRMLHLGHEEERTIYVEAIDEDAEREGIPLHGVGQIALRIVSETPIIHAELNTGGGWETGFFTILLGREIGLRYAREGPIPPDFHSINWYWIKGVSHDPINDDDFDKAKLFFRENNFTAIVGEDNLKFMKEGETYTLMAVGVDRRRDAIILNDAEHIYGGRVVVKVGRSKGARTARVVGARTEAEPVVDAEFEEVEQGEEGPTRRGFFGRTWDKIRGKTKTYVTTRDRERERRQKEALVRAARATAKGVKTAAGAMAAGAVAAGKYAKEKRAKLGEAAREKIYSSQEYNDLIVRTYNYDAQEIIQENSNDATINIPLNKRIYFIPLVIVGDITQYEVKWKLDNTQNDDRFFEYTNEEQAKGQSYAYVSFSTEGERLLTCAFIKNGNLYKEIKLRLVTEEIYTAPVEQREVARNIHVTLLSNSRQLLGVSRPKNPLIMNIKKGQIYYFKPEVLQKVNEIPRSVISDYQINVKVKNIKEGEVFYSEQNKYGYIKVYTEGHKIISLTFTTAGEVAGKCTIELYVIPEEDIEPERPTLIAAQEVKPESRWKFLEVFKKRKKALEPEAQTEEAYPTPVQRRDANVNCSVLVRNFTQNKDIDLGIARQGKPFEALIEQNQVIHFYPKVVQKIDGNDTDVTSEYQILMRTNAEKEVAYSDETKTGAMKFTKNGRKLIELTFTTDGTIIGKCILEIIVPKAVKKPAAEEVQPKRPLLVAAEDIEPQRPALVAASTETINRRNVDLSKSQTTNEISYPEIFVQYKYPGGDVQRLMSSNRISHFKIKGINNELINFKVLPEKSITATFAATWKAKGGNIANREGFSCFYTPSFPGDNLLNCGIYSDNKLVKGFIIKIEEEESSV
ncbi:MAG TPA: hypothetical protein VJG30_02815 [Candidatus Nanoarchaeia archaeon]|nr:hypothetical protein [Candidatus Nanoarchaeia archaeon]